MSDLSKTRVLIETIQELAIFLTDEEISEIGTVLLNATSRLIEEEKEE